MIPVNNIKQFRWSLFLVFVFSIVGFLVAIQGANAPVHFLKPVLSIAWLFILFFTLSKYTINRPATIVCNIMIAYAILSAFVSCEFSYSGLSSVLSGEFFLLPYISLLYGCFIYDEGLLILLKKIMIISLIIFVIILISFRNMIIQENALSAIADMAEQGLSLDTVTKYFCFSSGLLMLLFPGISRKAKIVVIISFALSLIASIYLARRNLIVTNLLFIVMAIFIYLRYNQSSSLLKKLIIYALVVFIGFKIVDLAISIFSGINNNVFFSQLVNRVDSDSRSHVLIPFYEYMNESPIYWIFGHGIDSRYYSDLGWRGVIETGYLQIIMKVGLVCLFAYIILLLRTVRRSYRGNLLMQACSAFIVICMMETIYAGVPMFGFTWIMLWICVGICHSGKLKNMSNEEIRNILCR